MAAAIVPAAPTTISYDGFSAYLSAKKDFRLPSIEKRIGSILQITLEKTQEDEKTLKDKKIIPAEMDKRFTMIREGFSSVMKQRIYAITALVLGTAALIGLFVGMSLFPANLVLMAYVLMLISVIPVVAAPIILYKSVGLKKTFEEGKTKFDIDLQTLQNILNKYGQKMTEFLPELSSKTIVETFPGEIAEAQKVLAEWRAIITKPATTT